MSGSGNGLWPHSPAPLFGPWWARPSIAIPAPAPVPRMTANTTRYPAPAPSVASETARQSASFEVRTSRPSTRLRSVSTWLAVHPGGRRALGNAGHGVEGPRQPDPEGAAATSVVLDRGHQVGDDPEATLVVRPWRIGPLPGKDGSVVAEGDSLDLRSTPVDSQQHDDESQPRGGPRHRRAVTAARAKANAAL